MRRRLFLIGCLIAFIGMVLLIFGGIASMSPPWLERGTLDSLRIVAILTFAVGALLALAAGDARMVLELFGRD